MLSVEQDLNARHLGLRRGYNEHVRGHGSSLFWYHTCALAAGGYLTQARRLRLALRGGSVADDLIQSIARVKNRNELDKTINAMATHLDEQKVAGLPTYHDAGRFMQAINARRFVLDERIQGKLRVIELFYILNSVPEAKKDDAALARRLDREREEQAAQVARDAALAAQFARDEGFAAHSARPPPRQPRRAPQEANARDAEIAQRLDREREAQAAQVARDAALAAQFERDEGFAAHSARPPPVHQREVPQETKQQHGPLQLTCPWCGGAIEMNANEVNCRIVSHTNMAIDDFVHPRHPNNPDHVGYFDRYKQSVKRYYKEKIRRPANDYMYNFIPCGLPFRITNDGTTVPIDWNEDNLDSIIAQRQFMSDLLDVPLDDIPKAPYLVQSKR